MADFRPLFSISSTHEFFSGGLCTHLDFVPTPTCEYLLKNAEVLLRQTSGKVALYYDADRPGALPDVTHFDFCVHAHNGDFQNYTDGITAEAGKSFYFCNTHENLHGDGCLSREASVSSADLYPEHLIPPELLQEAGHSAFLVRITTDVRGLENSAYVLPLRARRTTWQYLISGSGIVGTDLYVAAPGGEEAFEYRGEVTLPNGRPACHFRSRTQFPLLDDQPTHYALRERYNGRLVVRKLPTPSPRLLARENFDGEEVLTSQMFVNL